MDWQGVIDRLNELLDKISAKMQELVDKVNSILSKIPGWAEKLLDGFMAMWNKMLEKWDEFWGWLTDKLAYVGNPFALRDAADAWHSSVGQPTYDGSQDVEADADLGVDDSDKWQGSAAEAYRSKVPEQRDAMQGVSQTFVTPIAAALTSVKWGIYTFWVGIVFGLVALVGAFVLAIGSAATVVGAILSPEFVVGGIIAFLLAGGGAFIGLVAMFDQAREGLRSLSRYNTDSWPSFAL
jgi:hypothetical protein